MNVDEASRFLRDIISDPKTNVESVNRATLALRELQPEPRIIDWQKVVDRQLPVRGFDAAGRDFFSFLSEYRPDKARPFGLGSLCVQFATLETGQWVFNSSGENPWPEGVLVEVASQGDGPTTGRASSFRWDRSAVPGDILASRAVGLEEGWSYGGGQ